MIEQTRYIAIFADGTRKPVWCNSTLIAVAKQQCLSAFPECADTLIDFQPARAMTGLSTIAEQARLQFSCWTPYQAIILQEALEGVGIECEAFEQYQELNSRLLDSPTLEDEKEALVRFWLDGLTPDQIEQAKQLAATCALKIDISIGCGEDIASITHLVYYRLEQDNTTWEEGEIRPC